MTVKLVPVVLVLLTTLAIASPQNVAVTSSWTPPPSRKSKTTFAPKPFAGNNIFKGEAEVWLADTAVKLEGGILKPLDDQFIAEYVTKVGSHVAAHSVKPMKKYEFIVTAGWRVDAMTAGGGRVYITKGMLEELESEDELAGVLAHEIAHDAFAHTGKTLTRQMFWLTGTRKVKSAAEVEEAIKRLIKEAEKKPLANLTETLLGFSRFDELEADRAAFYNVYKAGYNPRAISSFYERRAKQDKEIMGPGAYVAAELLFLLISTHPPTEQRTLALSWESNFVKMPPKTSRHDNASFTEMKSRLAAMTKRR